MSRFEHELVKRIDEEIERLKEEMAAGLLPDYTAYKEACARIAAYRRTQQEFVADVNQKLAES